MLSFIQRAGLPEYKWMGALMTRISLPTLVTISILIVLSRVDSASAADCLLAAREIRFADGSTRVKNYVCRLGGATKPQIEVEFNRVSEAAAGSLVEGTPYPDLERVLSSSQVIRNDVFSEAKALFDTYGTKGTVETCYKFQAGGESDPRFYQTRANAQPCGERRTLWYITFPDQANLTTIDMPLPGDQRAIKTSPSWPPDWNFFYSKCRQNSWIECTILWRGARKSDIADYWENRKRYEAQIKLVDRAPPLDADSAAEAEKAQREVDETKQRYFSFIEHLMGGTWRDDFLTITGTYAGCGSGFDFSLRTRQMVLETAFVRNISNQPLTLDGLFGSPDASRTLRQAREIKPDMAPVIVPLPAITLRPGERVAIPLRITFEPSGGAQAIFQSGLEHIPVDRAAANKAFQSIMSTPPGTIFKDADPAPLKKVRESFGRPTVPELPTYVYGPGFDLKGLTLSGQRVVFDAAAWNFFKIAAGDGYGSCPVLYVHDTDTSAWVRRGKVIHNASSPEKQMSERVEFAGLATRFSIREEELEVSYLSSVRLEILLPGDTVLQLSARNAEELDQPDRFMVIKAGQRRDFVFDLPAEVKSEDVKRSTLIVTGYYLRYAGIAIADH
jgi:hypothetical protein